MTRGEAEEHFSDVDKILKLLEDAGYRASEEKTEMFKKEIDWIGYHIDERGIKPKNVQNRRQY